MLWRMSGRQDHHRETIEGGGRIVVMMALIIASAIATALVLGLTGASWGMIVLGYVLGGWVGLILGVPVLLLAGRCGKRTARRGAGTPRKPLRDGAE